MNTNLVNARTALAKIEALMKGVDNASYNGEDAMDLVVEAHRLAAMVHLVARDMIANGEEAANLVSKTAIEATNAVDPESDDIVVYHDDGTAFNTAEDHDEAAKAHYAFVLSLEEE